jgi:hypothetical protein
LAAVCVSLTVEVARSVREAPLATVASLHLAEPALAGAQWKTLDEKVRPHRERSLTYQRSPVTFWVEFWAAVT